MAVLRRGVRVGVCLALSIVVAGCGHKLAPGEAPKLRAFAASFNELEPALAVHRRVQLVVAGLGELNVGRSAECQRALTEVGRSQFADRIVETGASAIEACRMPCLSTMAQWSGPDTAARMAAAQRLCPASPPFSASEASAMARGNALVYVLVRGLWVETAEAARRGTDEDRAAWAAVEALRPRVAAAIASWPASGPPPGVEH